MRLVARGEDEETQREREERRRRSKKEKRDKYTITHLWCVFGVWHRCVGCSMLGGVDW